MRARATGSGITSTGSNTGIEMHRRVITRVAGGPESGSLAAGLSGRRVRDFDTDYDSESVPVPVKVLGLTVRLPARVPVPRAV